MRKTRVSAENRKLIIAAFIVITSIFFLRVIHLDQDLPPWGIVNYQPIDEGSYSILALNMINHGSVNVHVNIPNLSVYTPPHVRVNVIGNLISYISMRTLGDNYYGFRLPSILCSIGIMIFVFLSFREVNIYYKKKSSDNKLLVFILLLFMVTDFTFLVASRVVEPSIVRAFMNLIIFYIFIKLKSHNKLRYFIVGLLCTLSVFSVYITNIFIFFPVGLILLFELFTKGWKKFGQYSGYILIGILAGLCLTEPYYRIIWGTSSIGNLLSAVRDFSNVPAYATNTAIKGIIKNIVSLFSANIFLYNPSFLCISIVVTVFNLYYGIKQKSEISIFIVGIIIGIFLQTLYSNDYIIRKLIVIYPILILNIFIFVNSTCEFIKIKMIEGRDTTTLLAKIISITLITAAFIISLLSVIYRLKIIKDGTILDFQHIDKILIVLLGIGPMFIITILSITCVMRKYSKNNWHLAKGIVVVFILSFSLSIYMSFKYVYLNPTYTEKQVMISLGQVANSEYVLGEYENGFSLYNTIKPVLNTYENLGKYLEEDGVYYYFDYYFDPTQGSNKEYFNNIVFNDSKYTVYPVKVFKRSFKTFGVSRSVALYKKVLK